MVRHLEAYPKDPLAEVLEDVIAFDSYDPQLRERLLEVFRALRESKSL